MLLTLLGQYGFVKDANHLNIFTAKLVAVEAPFVAHHQCSIIRLHIMTDQEICYQVGGYPSVSYYMHNSGGGRWGLEGLEPPNFQKGGQSPSKTTSE